MTPADRAAAYFRQKPGAMTAAQRRRYRKKVFRGLQGEGVLFSRLPGLTSDSVASASTCATDSAPPPVGQTAVHAPTVVVTTNAATVGASPGGEP